MLRNLQVIAVFTLMISYAVAGTVSIGTASARGDMRVDNYEIQGNATLFDGSVIETGQASADLRLQKDTEIVLGRSSRATLYHDRMVLEQGETELAASTVFQLDASAVRVTSKNPDSRWSVSLKPGNTVEVTALTGAVGVTNENGVMLAEVLPGRPLTFAAQQDGNSTAFEGTGEVSYSNGDYFLTVTSTGTTYQIVGVNLANLVGQTVTITGKINVNATPAAQASAVVDVKKYKKAAGALPGSTAAGVAGGSKALLIAGILVAGGVGAGVGIYEATKPSASP